MDKSTTSPETANILEEIRKRKQERSTSNINDKNKPPEEESATRGQKVVLKETNVTRFITELDKEMIDKEINEIIQFAKKAKSIDEIILECNNKILNLVDAQRVTLYARDPMSLELFSKIATGEGMENIKEIRVPLDHTSLAGYTGLTKRTLIIKDAYDDNELKRIDPKLGFNKSYDEQTGFRTKQILAMPLTYKKGIEQELLGVIQFINKVRGDIFTTSDKETIGRFSGLMASVFKEQIDRLMKGKFGDLAVRHIITEEELDKYINISKTQNRELIHVLLENKVPKEEILKSLSAYFKYPYIQYNDDFFLPQQVKENIKIPILYLKTNHCIPIDYKDSIPTIAIDDPLHQKASEIIQYFPSRDAKFVIALKDDIDKFIDVFENGPKKNDFEIDDKDFGELNIIKEEEEEDIKKLSENDSVIVKLVNKTIIDAYLKKASDIHIETDNKSKSLIIRFRIDGELRDYKRLSDSNAPPILSRVKILSDLNITEKRLPQDGKIKFKYNKEIIELRVATIPTSKGENVVMRILASGKKPLTLEELNLSSVNLERIKSIISNPYGISLVVGPTGSGKTTTLHSVLQTLNSPDKKIWTVEDPVEITQAGLNQVQTNTKIGYTFATALRSFLRADPDIIMVGEMRDKETAQIGIEASLTGHLVLSTLHTNSAPETIIRLIDLGIDPFNFADALLGVVAQRLVKTLCKECKSPYTPDSSEKENLIKSYGEEYFPELNIDMDKLKLYQKSTQGCPKCEGKGYKGRTGIHEVLTASKTLKLLIQKKATAEEIRELAIKEGMRTLHQDGIFKVLKGDTNISQITSVCKTE